MQQQEKEEIWFARVVLILGAKAAMEALVNLAWVLKLAIPAYPLSFSTNLAVASADCIAATIVAIYLLTGGTLLSRLAYGHPAPRGYIFVDIGFPDWPHTLAMAFRAFGGYQMILAVSSIALAIAYHYWSHAPIGIMVSNAKIEVVYTLERVVIGFLLLALGGNITRFFLRIKEPSESAEPAPKNTDTMNF